MIDRLRDVGLWALYFPLRAMVLLLPLGAARAAGRATGRLHAAITARWGSRRLEENLTALLGPDRASATVRRYRVGKHENLIEHFLIAARGRATVDRLLGDIHGSRHLDAAIEGGGAVLALFHYGNIRMLAALGHRGYPLVQLLNRTAAHAGRGHSRSLAQRVRDLKIRMDRKMPARFLHWRPGAAAREVYRVAQEGELLLVHLDGSRGASFASFDFLGGRAPFSTGPARIAWRTERPLIPVFCVRREDGRHDLIIEPPVEREGGAEAMTARCVRLLEGQVRRQPEQWWTWARLRMEMDPEGRLRLEPRPAEVPERDEAALAAGASP